MRIRLLAIAGAAAMVLSTPAMAATGWYLGLDAGLDHGTGVGFTSPFTSPPSSISAKNGDDAIVAGSLGYKWNIGLRIEMEAAYTSHSFVSSTVNSSTSIPPAVANVVNSIGGSVDVTSAGVNIIYDIPLSSKWTLSLGGGYGVGYSKLHSIATIASTAAGKTTTQGGDLAIGSKTGLESQLIIGTSYSVTPSIDLYADYRRRSNEINRNFSTSFAQLAPVYVASVSDDSVMVGLRWYLGAPR
jgi:OOP family OmpA-OmpF porin